MEQKPEIFTPDFDKFFAPIQNTKPYLKLAFEGFAGSGKTYTAAMVAIGLYKRIESKKPIIIFDTERASKFLKPILEKEGIQAYVRESRSLADLKETMKRCREGLSDVLIIDSISHCWEDFLAAYRKKVNRVGLQFQDWGVIKPAWKSEFSDPFVTDPVHIIMTGRAGYEYETEKNEETGRREIFKSGIKMKVEGETAYEPDILVLMERFEKVIGEDKRTWREATIIKDRSTVIDGRTIENPTYKDFEPAISLILDKPVQSDITPEASAGDLIKLEEEKQEWRRRKDISLETIEGILTEAYPGQSAIEKKSKVSALEFAYSTKSWTAIQQKKVEEIEAGHEKLKEYIKINPLPEK